MPTARIEDPQSLWDASAEELIKPIDVDLTEFLHAGVDQRLGDRRLRGGARLRDRTGNALGRVAGRVGVASVDDNAGPLRGQQFGYRQTDAASAADDNGAATGQRFANRSCPPGRTA